jgi:flavin-dependent dehydrogenase
MTAVTSADVLVVGAGVAGTTVAVELAKAGARVVVAEPRSQVRPVPAEAGDGTSEIHGHEPQLPLDIYRLERFERGGVEAEGVWGGEGISRGTREVQA